ncbi:MAG: diguanylate cyclase (GGDEF)-like protein [Paracoccaceae bacterium]|jgi:diguanylate cyclase (GGDEF)-like protein
MANIRGTSARFMKSGLSAMVTRGEILAVYPLLTIAAFWWGDQSLLFAASVAFPALLALQAALPQRNFSLPAISGSVDGLTGLHLRPALLDALDRAIANRAQTGKTSACLMVEIDNLGELSDRWGSAGIAEIFRRSAERISAAMRSDDIVARLDNDRFGIVLHAVQRTSLDTILALVDGLQSNLAEPIIIGGTSAHITCSVGFCTLEQIAGADAAQIIEATEAATLEARRNGPAAARSYSADLTARMTRTHELADEVEDALKAGQIRPWFQPQISTDTGAITGFEALVRWAHPKHGLLQPAEFLPAISAASQMERLGETVLYHALTALRAWDKIALTIPSVSVNFSSEELRNPSLADRLKWEVDRFDLRPSRLTVEILETVAAASDDDTIMYNIKRMREHGFNLDLDDFGTGQASIANIRRFGVNRIKIDRSFITRMDQDASQQSMVSAILSLAEQLGIDTLAEGVETLGEHSMLSQLGCGHIQGFGLARPMPFEDTIPWIAKHSAKIALAPSVGRRAG